MWLYEMVAKLASLFCSRLWVVNKRLLSHIGTQISDSSRLFKASEVWEGEHHLHVFASSTSPINWIETMCVYIHSIYAKSLFYTKLTYRPEAVAQSNWAAYKLTWVISTQSRSNKRNLTPCSQLNGRPLPSAAETRTRLSDSSAWPPALTQSPRLLGDGPGNYTADLPLGSMHSNMCMGYWKSSGAGRWNDVKLIRGTEKSTRETFLIRTKQEKGPEGGVMAAVLNCISNIFFHSSTPTTLGGSRELIKR